MRGGASALIFVIIMLFAFMFFLVLRQPSEEGAEKRRMWLPSLPPSWLHRRSLGKSRWNPC